MQTGFLLYRSRTDLDPRSPGCAAILAEARSRNRALDLTGRLHLEDGRFYQWLEGPPEALDTVRAKIAGDPRHRDMTILQTGWQEQRQFQGWDMGFGISDPGTLFAWIAQHGVSVSDTADFARGLLGFLRAG